MSVQNVKRGDVIRTFDEWVALPKGSVVVTVDGEVHHRTGMDAHVMMEDKLPALVRVVGPVEPEWLAAAAAAVAPWISPAATRRDVAGQAVAAADRARGIVNSREDFDALPSGTVVANQYGRMLREAFMPSDYIAADSWPALVIVAVQP